MVKGMMLSALLALAACQHGGGGFCDLAKPMRPSAAALAAMTPAEVADMLGHNEKGARLCGWRP